MNIKIVSVGKIKENYAKKWIEEFLKRLSAYAKMSVVEVAAQAILEEAEYEKYKRVEGEKILEQIKPGNYVIALELSGKSFSSEELANEIENASKSGINQLVFVIGGANGLSSAVLERADLKLSLSKMTFTHQMVRLLLLEQIYRAFKILHNENYHR